MEETPLSRHLADRGTELCDVDGVAIPRRFDEDARTECAAAREAAALFDLGWMTHLVATGKHRARFLHNMTTCDIQGLEPGGGRFGMVLDHQGKLIAQFQVDCEDERLRLETARSRVDPMEAQLLSYRVADRVRFDREPGRHVLSVAGPRAEAILEQALGEAPGLHEEGAWREARLDDVPVLLRRNALRLALPGWDVTVDAERAPEAWDALVRAGARPGGRDAREALRVAAGVPRVGVDMGEANVPLESRHLYDTVDWDKGCYIGQEVVAMMHYRGRPNKHLMVLRLPHEAELPEAGTKVQNDRGRTAGTIGTALWSPELDEPLALAVLKRKHAADGGTVLLPDGEEATIADPPVGAASA